MSNAPPVEVLLDIDREYRDKVRAGQLPKIAPRRFNPDGTAWLPVLHTRYGPWHFTALFSNTELAHELHRTHDWVVIFFCDGDGEDGQFTVVTERRGASTGKRVVRGREPECANHYRSLACLARAERTANSPR
jgi:putative hydrolase